ncbi:VOC family protein [Parvibaculum sp.]|uniref:VOC family protein n=1 Tax=Parvibaculum sp. TaxID=2024848 RepID=UPI0032111B21
MTGEALVGGIDRIMIGVRDLAEAERIYTRMLGRSPSWRYRDGGTERVIYRLGNVSLDLLSSSETGAPWGSLLSAQLDRAGEGIVGIVFSTPDATRTVEGLKARGLPAVLFPEAEVSGPAGERRRWKSLLVPAEIARGLFMMGHEQLSPEPLPEAALRPGVGEGEAISALDHVVVMTSDAEACKHLFGEQFGIRLALDQSKPEWGVRQLFFRLGGVTLEVVEPLDKAKAPANDYFMGLAWKVGHVGAVRERLVREGADVSEVKLGRKKGTEVATIRKPTCGVPVLLIGPAAESA